LYQAERNALDIAASGQKDAMAKAALVIARDGTTPSDAVKKDLEELAGIQQNFIEEAQAQINGDTRTMLWVLWGSTLLSLALALIIGTVLRRGISTSTNAALNRAKAIAEGDLSGVDVAITTDDEMKDITVAINKMQANLLSTVQSIAANADNVAHASEEFPSVSQQIFANSEETSAQAGAVSAATEEVNGNLQTVVTATEEMTASIQEIPKNAAEAARIAESCAARLRLVH
jgi:methyl-accepting chemotaxis protein